jgi:glutathione S-transferase
MEYIDIDAARGRSGLRLVLTAGVPGPWGEAAKAVFRVKGIPFVAVRQTIGAHDEKLLAWTRQTSAPVAMYEDERPRSGWAEILFLAERLAPEPALLPSDPRERAFALGLAFEICGEQGLGWTRRLMMMAGVPVGPNSMPWKYGCDDAAAVARAPARVVEILDLLADQLKRQQDGGRRYLVGNRLSAVDIYWATFSNLLVPLPPEQSPMPDYMRKVYATWDTAPGAKPVDSALLAHRDFVFAEHLGLPQEF